MEDFKFKYLILTKLSSDNENSKNNPESRVGYQDIRGYCTEQPRVGHQLLLYATTSSNDPRMCWTFKIQNIDYENKIIKTLNSTYSYEIINNIL